MSYAKTFQRVSKENLYMIIALWMEDFVDKAPKDSNKVGAVLVLPNDVVFAADCSRDGVHAAARLLMKHSDKAKGCKMFMSRKPCPMCAKLLVQSKVERVFFPPFEPEYYRLPDNDARNESQMKEVDMLFAASPIAETKLVLEIEEPDRQDAVPPIHEELVKKYRLDQRRDWVKFIKKNLPWPAFNSEMQGEVQKYFENAVKWVAKVLPEKELNFQRVNDNSDDDGNDTFDPVNNTTHAKQARHFLTIARFLAKRTDDPKTGVGAVIVSPKMEILALGWNGFPFKALYGEFPRASRSDPSILEKKYPYIIHAEQNALLMRNNKSMKGAILFVTKTPCNECTPLIAMQAIKTVVVDDDVLSSDDSSHKNGLDYKMFLDMVKHGKFFCFQTKEQQADPGPSSASRELLPVKEECNPVQCNVM